MSKLVFALNESHRKFLPIGDLGQKRTPTRSPEAVAPNINYELTKLRAVAVVLFRAFLDFTVFTSPALSYIGRNSLN
ncbi:hypothetical protein P3G55_22100 [Leptospira sp. 96542]|nr:hypothetical protein [Leptospira sp. 96542]